MASKKASMTFAEAAAQRLEERFRIEVEGMPVVIARRISSRENRLLKESCLRKGKKPEDINQPGAIDDEAHTRAFLAASCENEDGSAAFPDGPDQLEGYDEMLLNDFGMKILTAMNGGRGTGNA